MEKWSEREALVVRQQNVRYTYAELKQRVDALAMGLLKLGLQPGDRIGIWSPNNTEWVLLQFASAKIGLILVCINPAYRSYELSYALKKVGCKALVMAPRFRVERLRQDDARTGAGAGAGRNRRAAVRSDCRTCAMSS